MAATLAKEKIEIKTAVKVTRAKKENGNKILTYEDSGKLEKISGDEILLAAGKTANTQELGLDLAGVETAVIKSIMVNESL